MKNIKLVLIFTIAALMLVNTGILFAQENRRDEDKEKDKKEKVIEVEVPIIDLDDEEDVEEENTNASTTTPGAPNAGATTTPSSATTTPGGVTTDPQKVATSSVEAAVVVPPKESERPRFPFNLFAPQRQTAGTTTSTTTPAVVMSAGAGNTNIGNGFFAANYYTSGAFPPGVARSLMVAGFLSGILGLLLLIKGGFATTRSIRFH